MLIHLSGFIYLLSKESTTKGIESLDGHIQKVVSSLQRVDTYGDDDSDKFDYDSYAEVAKDLETDITCLHRLRLLIGLPPLQPPMVDAVSVAFAEQREVYRPYCDLIRNRFPDGDERLIFRLGKANFDRYLRWVKRNNEVHDEPDETECIQQAHTVVASAFHDSGLGSSVPSKSSYAETVMSYGTDGNGQSVRVPPLSEEAKQGAPFTCVACSKTVSISNNSLWKRHLYEDLCPWMCLDPDCPSGNQVFSSRNDWIAHLSFEHQLAPYWASFGCPLCCSEIGSGKTSITQHLGNHLEEIALGSLPMQTEPDEEEDEKSQTSELPRTDVAAPSLLHSPSPPPAVPLPEILPGYEDAALAYSLESSRRPDISTLAESEPVNDSAMSLFSDGETRSDEMLLKWGGFGRPRRPRAGEPNAAIWESYKEHLWRLYLVEDHPLKRVMEMMKQQYGFDFTYVPVSVNYQEVNAKLSLVNNSINTISSAGSSGKIWPNVRC